MRVNLKLSVFYRTSILTPKLLQVYQIGKADLNALNSFVGAKKFMFGDKVADVDAAVFGCLVELYYTDKGVFHQYIKSKSGSLNHV